MGIRRKPFIVVELIVALMVFGAALVVPVLVNLDRYRAQVIAYLEQASGKQIRLGTSESWQLDVLGNLVI